MLIACGPVWSIFQSVVLAIMLAVLHQPTSAGQSPTVETCEPGSDIRLGPLKTLDDHFPFEPPRTVEEWSVRSASVRHRIAVALGLYPLPRRTPLNAVVHGRTEMGDYSIEKVYFESLPGFFVTGNLYRPVGRTGPFAGVLSPHGHWNNGRFYDAGPEAAAKEVASGAEFDLEAARVPLQSRCVQLARMGCVVFHYDMIGYADSQQISQKLAHGFAEQRPEMNSLTGWGLFSPQAESHLQSVMGLQTWNSIRSLDFLESLPDVDRARLAVTGASGGGTQTMILAALDPRPCVVFPAVMVSTAMQGGCTCENASLLRVGTGNVEFAALFAPKPQGFSSANDWTKDMSRDGFPQLQTLYRLLGHPEKVRLSEHTEFGHNYNAVSRKAMYELFNEALGLKADVGERPFARQSPEDLSVWNQAHPKPTGGDDFERKLLQYLHEDSQSQIKELPLATSADVARMWTFFGPAFLAIFGRQADSEAVQWHVETSDRTDGMSIERGCFKNSNRREQVPATIVKPAEKWNGRYLVILSISGRAVLERDPGVLTDDVRRLCHAGFAVVGLDCYWQGASLPDQGDASRGRLVENGREAAGYTFGYNDSTFSRRVHDVLNVVVGLSEQGTPPIDLLAVDGLGPVGSVARTLAGSRIAHAALNVDGFRFSDVNDLRDLNFQPGGAKYGDISAIIALAKPGPLWLRGEPKGLDWIERVYEIEQASQRLHKATANDDNPVDWLIKVSRNDR